MKILDVKPLKDVISHADQGLAEDLKLPLSFFLYKSKSKCKGCVGCEDDTVCLIFVFICTVVKNWFIFSLERRRWWTRARDHFFKNR